MPPKWAVDDKKWEESKAAVKKKYGECGSCGKPRKLSNEGKPCSVCGHDHIDKFNPENKKLQAVLADEYKDRGGKVSKPKNESLSGILEGLSRRGDRQLINEADMEKLNEVTEITERFHKDVRRILRAKGYRSYERLVQSAQVSRQYTNEEKGETIAFSGWDKGVYRIRYSVVLSYMQVRGGDFVDTLDFNEPLDRMVDWEKYPDIRAYENFLGDINMRIRAL